MGKRIDITGKKFGRLIAIRDIGSSNDKGRVWEFQCDCGKVKTARSSDVRNGKIRSCGCLHRDMLVEEKTTHNMHGTRIYRIWRNIKTRCLNPNASHYSRYGGQGISICDEWRDSFESFRDWALSHGYSDELSVDRIDNDKGYCPDNCRWATLEQQAVNRRTPKTNKSGHPGVIWREDRKKWVVQIRRDKVTYNLGQFDLIEDAVEAREAWKLSYDQNSDKG